VKRNFGRHLVYLAIVALTLTGCAAQKELVAKNVQYLEVIEKLTAENQNLKKEVTLARAERERLLSEKAALEKAAKMKAEAPAPRRAAPPTEVEKAPLKIVLQGRVFFRSGQAQLIPSGKAALRKIASSLKRNYPGLYIQIGGHTDSQPIKKTRRFWKSNWELSTARALSVLHFLVDECGLESERVYVAGYGFSRPVASNNTSQGRSQNRRVEIIIEAKK